MPRHLLPFVFSAFAAFCCGAQTPEYKAAQYSGAINRFYTLCFDPENMLWAGGPSNGLPYQLPNGTLLHRVDANLNLKTGRYFNAEPDIEYPAEICWDAGDRIIGCGNYQDGGFGTGFVFRFRPQTTPSQLLFIKKIEGGEVRLSGLIENTADTSLIVYGTSLAGGVQRGELFKLHRNTGTLRPAFPKRYTAAGQGLSFDAAILQEGRLYTAGASWLGGVLDGNSVTCINAATGEPLWLNSTHIVGTHLKARDLVFTDEDNFDGGSLFVVSNSDNPQNPAQGSHIFLQKINLDGSLQWTQKIDLPDWTDEYAEEILTVSGGFLIYGRSRNPAQQGVFLLKTDYSGKPVWAKRILQGSGTWLPDWPAQAQMLVRNEAIYLACNALVNSAPASPPNVGLIFKLQLDGTLANCPIVQPTPAVNLPVGNQGNVNFLLNEEASPLQVNTVAASVMGSGGTFSPGTICQQTGYVCNDFPDLTARVDSITCSSTDGVIAHLSVCNLGKTVPDTGFHLTFYDKNPLVGGAMVLWSIFFAEKPAPGACMQLQLPWDAALLQQPQVFTLVGADGNVPTPISLSSFPFSNGYAECDYANNLDSFLVKKPDCAPDSCHPSTFWKIFGRQGNWINISALRAAPDGNLYMAGRQDDHLTIGKMAPDGQFLWTRSLTLTPLQRPLIAEIIVDSEGMIVGSGNLTTPNTGENKGVFAFRYDPAAHQVLWVRNFNAFRSTEGGILEKTPGGNFLLHYNITTLPGQIGAEILELDRTTGQIVPAFAKRYEYQYSQAFSNIVAHGGAIYATGYTIRKVGNSGFRRMVMAKLDASTGGMIWSRTGLTDWPQASDFAGGDLIVDDNSLITMYYGSETSNSAFGNLIKLYLQKTTLDGEVLWVKRYDLPAAPRELLAVSDGYIIFAGASERFILKTDKEGNLLTSKKLDSQTFFFAGFTDDERNQVERIGQYLYFAHNTARSNQSYGYTTLLKTDLNLEMDFDCDLDPYPVQASSVAFQPNIMAQQVVTESVPTQQTLSTTLGSDFVILHKSCPTCATQACTNLPDITAHVDSITCSLTQGAVAHISICNLGQVMPSAGLHLTFYDKNPLAGGAVALQSVFLEEKPAPGTCVQTVVQLDVALFQRPKIYTLVGADKTEIPPFALDDFPFANGFLECDYANNLDSFATVLPPIQKLDLGPDRSICTGQTVTLDAGSGYVLYNWLDGGSNVRTYTVGATGQFAVEVVDACGRKQRDTVRVTIFPYPKRTIHIALLPGDSVVIGGTTYKSTATFVDTIPSLTGPCDTIATYYIRLDSLHCTGKAETFLQANYVGNHRSIGRVVLPASDGSIYTGGESDFLDWQFVLTKTAANGKVLWSRGFDFANSFQNAALIDHLIEDSEGKLVGTFTQVGVTGGKVHFTVFRYDPQTDQVLWVKNVRTQEAASTPRILAEIKAGGNFVVAYSLASLPQGTFSEVCQLDRATGNPVGNSARRYGPGVTFYGGTTHKGILYANGLVRDTTTSSIAAKNGYVKIDLSTGQPIDQRILKSAGGSGVAGQAAVVGPDEHLVSLLFSSDTAIWLRKTTLNGNVLWLKRYKIAGLLLENVNTVGISAVSDGYVFALEFFGANSQYIGFGLLKADLDGNIVWAKQFDALSVLWGRSPQIMQARGNRIYLTGALDVPIATPAKTSGALVAQLDKDGNAGQDCGFFKNISVSASDRQVAYEPAVVGLTTVGRPSENAQNGPRTNYDPDIYTRCSRCFDPCAIALALPPFQSLCAGDSLTLQAQEDFAQYTWQDGSTGSSLVVTQPGLYYVTVKDKCGAEQRDSVGVGWATPPVVQKIVVLLPGESIVIAGKTYSAPAKFEVIIPSKTGICDTVAQYTVVVSPSGCSQPRAFLQSFDGAQSRVIAADQNNGAYVLGESPGATTLARFDSVGHLLWVREIIRNISDIGHYAYPVSLIQDSDGMLTGCGTHSNNGQTVVFRYDPSAHQMLWLQVVSLEANFTTDAPHDILEEKPGGHFLLLTEHSASNVGAPFFKSEILRLDRTTGALIGPAYRYGLSQFREAVVRGSALYVTGTLQDPSVVSINSGGVLKIDLTTDQVLWAKRLTLSWPNSYGGEDLLIDADGNLVSLLTRINEFVLQKHSPDGILLWQRKYTVNFPGTGGAFGYNIRLLPDGSYAVALTGNLNDRSSITIAKIAPDGPVKWAKLLKDLRIYGSPGTQWLDVRGNALYFTHGATEPYSTLLGKLDASGDISGGCQLAEDVQINYASSFIGQIPAAPPVESRAKTLFAPGVIAPVVLGYTAKLRCVQCESFCDTIRVSRNIAFYPGDTIVIGGTAYTQPDTVVQNFTTSAGCDSVVTNILQLIITAVKIDCPTDLTVTLPPNETTTVVDYPLPTATTDCPDQTIALRLLQGLSVGGSFPQGKTLVCYEAANQCGIRDTCCFTVTAVIPEQPCDVKTPPGCVRYELLSIQLDALGQRRYRVRLTNNCASPLRFAYLQLPNGVLAAKPAHNATYNSPSGSAYAVRNPNASPFYSVRYEAVVENLNNGKSDIFEYTLPQQSAPAYIRAASRLADGTYSEAHLNTFFCPVLPHQGAENRSADFPGSLLPGHLSVWPNPTDGTLFVNLNDWQGQTIRLQVLNAQGQTVLSQQVWAENGLLELALPANMVNGLYYLRAVEMVSGQRPSPAAAVRFVVER